MGSKSFKADEREASRNEQLWKRIAQRDDARPDLDKDAERLRDAFFHCVGPHLEWLGHLIGHLVRYSEAIGELVRDELNPEEIVDESIIRAYHEFLKHGSVRDVRSWLTRLAVDCLDEEINRLATQRSQAPIHSEDDVPETPPQQEVSQLGEEILYFYQPDEDLKMEDVIADRDAGNPEDELAARELRECIRSALRDIPGDWRRILLMHYGEEQPVARLALSLKKPATEVRRIISYSTRYIRERLIESGCALTNRRRAA